MVFLALLLFIVGAVAWRAKSQVGFPLSQRMGVIYLLAWLAGAVLLVGSMAKIVDPGQAGVVVLFVRELAIPVMGAGAAQDAAEDPVAREIFSETLASARRLGVPVKLVYLVGGSVVDRILQTATDVSASRIYMQLSKRQGIMRFFKGDVIGPVAERLPEHTELVIRA